MKLIDRYIFGRVLTAMLAVLLVILSIDALSSFVDQMDNLDDRFTLTEALLYAVLKIPGGLEEYLGFSALIGAMIGLGSFTNTGELTVIRAAGYSILRIGWMVMKPALILIALGALVTEFISPELEQMAESRRDLLRGNLTTDLEESGLWIYDKGTYVHMDAVYPGGSVYGLSLYTLNGEADELEISYAERAKYGEVSWYQTQGSWSKIDREHVQTGVFSRRDWLTELTPNLLDMSVLEAEQMSISDLDNFSDYLGDDTREAREYQVQFWRKVLQPLSIATLVFVGISFVVGSNRQVAVGERIFVGVIVGVAFRVMQDILGPAATVWGFSPLLAVLVPTGFTMLMGAVLLKVRQ